MIELEIFKNFTENELNSLNKNLVTQTVVFRKNMTIMSNISKTSDIGIIISGTALIVKIDYNGNREIVSLLEKGDVFGALINSKTGDENVILSNSNCQISFINYSNIFNYLKYTWCQKFLENLMYLMSYKINFLTKRIEILSKKTIREKLLEYFYDLQKEQSSQIIEIPFSKLELSEYLAIDRTAMMRELKKLKDEKIIEVDNRRIKIILR